MNVTIPIDSIWRMLMPLSYDNKKWLADKLYEDIQRVGPVEQMSIRLDELCKLKEGWDGNNAAPVNPIVADNIRSVLQKCKDVDVASWVLFPDVNGNLYLDFKSDQIDAGIILSEHSFSYFAGDKDEQNVPFSVPVVLQVIKSINETTE